MKLKNSSGRVNERRIAAAARLETQLATGFKTEKKTLKSVELTEHDKERINKELIILNSKITSSEIAQSRRSKKSRSGLRY